MKLDVVLLTKNVCAEKSSPLFVKCLDGIYEAVPLHHLIVVDGFSQDETLSILERYNEKYQNVLLFQDNRGRGKARQLGISKVHTPWFVFVDSDLILHSDWFKIVGKYMNAGVGAIEGKPREFSLKSEESTQLSNAMLALRWRIRKQRELPRLGWTGSILIRTECVKDIVIPKILNTHEDHYIKRWITKRGFRCVFVDKEIKDHYGRFEKDKTLFSERGAYSRIFKYSTLRSLLLNLLKSFPKGFFTSLKFRNIKALIFSLSSDFYMLTGWLNWAKVLHRYI